LVCIAAITASMSATSISTATRVGMVPPLSHVASGYSLARQPYTQIPHALTHALRRARSGVPDLMVAADGSADPGGSKTPRSLSTSATPPRGSCEGMGPSVRMPVCTGAFRSPPRPAPSGAIARARRAG
jgi:hypothetical protein